MPAVPIHHTPTTDGAWDGPANEADLTSDLTVAIGDDTFAWQEAGSDGTHKNDWKFIHHMVGSDGKPGAANVKACISGIGVLHGGMGGTTIPEADKAGVEAHLKAHLRDAGKEGKSMDPEAETREGDEVTSPEALPTPVIPASPRRPLTTLREWCAPASTPIQVRMTDNGASFLGHASTTGQGYDVTDFLGSYRETIQPGAFAKTLRESPDVPLLFNHDGMPIANTRSKTSRLSEDDVGLRNEADLDRRQALTNDLCIALERGDLSQMSFSFAAVKQDWDDAYANRSVSEVRLFDTSIVTYPANPMTSAGLRSEMRDSMGREGMGLMWAARSALVEMRETRSLVDAATSVVDQALRALRAADEYVVARYGNQGRARLFAVAGLLAEIREGKVISSANQSLLEQALAALHAADDHLSGIDTALDEGQRAISGVLGVDDPDDDDPDKPANDEGADVSAAPKGDPVVPADGAGPRSVPASVLQAQRDLEVAKLRARRSGR